MDFSPEKLRARFKELTKQSDALEAKLGPLRKQLDDTVAGEGNITVKAARAKEEKLRPQIKALQEELYPVEMERAALARALGGKTGDPNEE